MTRGEALDKLLALARELATEGPADRHQDCSGACNELTLTILAMAGEDPSQFNPKWGAKSRLVCSNCGDAFDGPERDCPKPAPGRPFVDCGRGGHMFNVAATGTP